MRCLSAGAAAPGAPKRVDVLSFGAQSADRKALCAELSRAKDMEGNGLRVRCVHSVYGEALVAAIREARLVVGSHYYANASLPVHRVNQAPPQHRPHVATGAA